MNWAGIANILLLVAFGFVSLLLIGVVLIQKGRGGGLASAFGGGSGTATAFGSKTGDVLTWATSVIFGIFLLLAIILNLIANNRSSGRPAAAVPAVPTAPAGGAAGGSSSSDTPLPVTPAPASPASATPAPATQP